VLIPGAEPGELTRLRRGDLRRGLMLSDATSVSRMIRRIAQLRSDRRIAWRHSASVQSRIIEHIAVIYGSRKRLT
jgi:hypothetical protein